MLSIGGGISEMAGTERRKTTRTDADDAPTYLVRSAILATFSAVTTSLGLNPQKLLLNAKLDPVCLTRRDMLVPWVKVVSVIEQAAAQAKIGDLGVRLAVARGVPDIGPLLLLLREEPDLRSVLRSLQSYIHLHSPTFALTLDDEAEFPILKGELMLNAVGLRLAPQMTELGVCSVLLILRWLIGNDWSPAVVCFSHSAPADRSLHHKVFGCPVEFDRDVSGLVLSKEDLRRPISHSSPLLRRHAEEVVRALGPGNNTPFPASVMDLVAVMLPSGRCSSVRIARHLNMDRATLNRKLMATGQTYSSILQDVRKNLVEKFCSWDWPLVDVADQLGFSSDSAFSRWFRQSYGTTPSAWRKERRRRQAM